MNSSGYTITDPDAFSVFKVKRVSDPRGDFTKIITTNEEIFPSLQKTWSECFFSSSRRGTVRGMHFQTGIYQCSKIIYCIAGKILDVGLDLRQSNAGQVYQAELSPADGTAVYIPEGVAHGFQVLSDEATVIYLQSQPYSKPHDAGIQASSFGFDWPLPISFLSERDKDLPGFSPEEHYF